MTKRLFSFSNKTPNQRGHNCGDLLWTRAETTGSNLTHLKTTQLTPVFSEQKMSYKEATVEFKSRSYLTVKVKY
jgi:hypothetical protein